MFKLFLALRFDETPIHMAAHLGHSDVVRLLIDRKADVNAVNRFSSCFIWCQKQISSVLVVLHLFV